MSTHPFDNDGMVEFDHWVPTVKSMKKIEREPAKGKPMSKAKETERFRKHVIAQAEGRTGTRCRQCGKSECPRRHNSERQELVVSSLWKFARDIQTKPVNCRSCGKDSTLNGVALNIESVSEALAKIMEIFNYGVTPVQ